MTFPDVSEALEGLTETLQLVRETSTVADYESTEASATALYFEGVLQPMKPQRLLLKPEGERNWRWWTLWTTLDIVINAIVIDPENVRFRVTARTPWFRGGYYEYELTEATTPVGS